MRTALFYGTFDPVTTGHASVVARAIYTDLFDTIIVGVMTDRARPTLFTDVERVWMWQHTASGIHPERVEVVTIDDAPAFAARLLGCQFLFRGVRSAQEYEVEVASQRENHGLEPSIQTVFLLPTPEVADCSSGLVRGMIGKPGWKDGVKQYVPVAAWEALVKKFGKHGPAVAVL